MYLSSLAELILVISLILLAKQAYALNTNKQTAKYILISASGLVAITALLGSIKYAGVESVASVHTLLSFYSKHLAMPLLLSCILYLTCCHEKLTIGTTLLLAFGLLPLFGLPGALTDVSIVLIMFTLLAFHKSKKRIAASIAFLLGVPLSVWFSDNIDINMALFHLFLAAHISTLTPLLTKLSKSQ